MNAIDQPPCFIRDLDSQTLVRLAPSPIAGVGVFAIQKIRRGADPFPGIATDCPMEFVPEESIDSLSPEVAHMVRDFCLPRAHEGVKGRWVYKSFSSMDASFYMNHCSDSPNVRMVSDDLSDLCVFRAARPIEPGEELLFDYGRTPTR